MALTQLAKRFLCQDAERFSSRHDGGAERDAMLDGIGRPQSALADAGFAPRSRGRRKTADEATRSMGAHPISGPRNGDRSERTNPGRRESGKKHNVTIGTPGNRSQHWSNDRIVRQRTAWLEGRSP